MIEKIVISEKFLNDQIKKLNDILEDIADQEQYYNNNESNIGNLIEDAKIITFNINECGAFFSDILIDLPLYMIDSVIKNDKIEKICINEEKLEEDYGFL